MHKLDAWLEETGRSVAELAAVVGCSPTTLTRPLRGERNVGMRIAIEVEQATGGAVGAAEFLAICLEARKRREAARDRV